MKEKTENTNTIDPGILLVLSAPSGAGKTTLARRLLREPNFTNAQFSISYTTRKPRGSEQNGVDYHFVDVPTFQQRINDGQFLEWAEVHGEYYGSSQAVADQVIASNGLAIFDIDVQGGNTIKTRHPHAVLVFVLPPSITELERRLRDRRTDSEDSIGRRMLAARAEIDAGTRTYDYLIINDDLERALNELKSIVIGERCRRGRVDLTSLKLPTT